MPSNGLTFSVVVGREKYFLCICHFFFEKSNHFGFDHLVFYFKGSQIDMGKCWNGTEVTACRNHLVALS
jgi:hypothetical protein